MNPGLIGRKKMIFSDYSKEMVHQLKRTEAILGPLYHESWTQAGVKMILVSDWSREMVHQSNTSMFVN